MKERRVTIDFVANEDNINKIEQALLRETKKALNDDIVYSCHIKMGDKPNVEIPAFMMTSQRVSRLN